MKRRRKRRAKPARNTTPRLICEFQFGNGTKYRAVDFRGVRYYVGDHVIVYYGRREWIVQITDIWFSTVENKALFRHYWFWKPQDIRTYNTTMATFASDDEAHELILGKNRDTNSVELISRKCVVLNRDEFGNLFRGLSWERRKKIADVYWCARMFCQYEHVLRPLGKLLFPGDSIPKELLRKSNIWRNKYEMGTLIPDNLKPYDEQGRTHPLMCDQDKYDGVFVTDYALDDKDIDAVNADILPDEDENGKVI